MLKDSLYCDHCGEPIEGKPLAIAQWIKSFTEYVEYTRLPFNVASANKGESAILCNDCDRKLKKDNGLD